MPENESKISERISNLNGVNTKFFAICCEEGKVYRQHQEPRRFYITQAVLEPEPEIQKEDFVKVSITRDGFSYLLCVLRHNSIYQVNLNYVFEKGEKVAFEIHGKGKVFLCGYEIIDYTAATHNASSHSEAAQSSASSDSRNSEEIFEVSSASPRKAENELPSSREISKSPKLAVKDVSSKSFWKTFINDGLNIDGDDDDDDDDDDFSVGDEEESDEEEEEEEEDDDVEVEEVDEFGGMDDEFVGKVEEEEEEEGEEEEEHEDDDHDDDDDDDRGRKKAKKLSVSRKRKKALIDLKARKHLKKSSKNSSGKTSYNDEDSGQLSDSSPKKSSKMKKADKLNQKSAEKKKKKNALFKVSQNLTQTPQSDDSAKKLKGHAKIRDLHTSSSPVAKPGKMIQTPQSNNSAKKLQGNVKVRDLRMGSGPAAKPGKVIHVCYVGRSKDGTLADLKGRPNKPYSFRLGAQEVIEGLDVGLVGMRAGGKRIIEVPPHMGYKNIRVGKIPPNSTLVYVAELKAVT